MNEIMSVPLGRLNLYFQLMGFSILVYLQGWMAVSTEHLYPQ